MAVDGSRTQQETQEGAPEKPPKTASRNSVSWSFLLGSVAAAATLVFGSVAVAAPYAQPDAEVTVTVDERLAEPGVLAGGELPLTITQEAVDAALEMYGVSAYRPTNVFVSADAGPESLDVPLPDDPSAYSTAAEVTLYLGDPILGDPQVSHPHRVVSLTEDETLHGYDTRYTVSQVLQRAFSNGQSAGSVVAAAQTAAHLLHPAPRPMGWLAAAGVSLAVASFAFYRWYRHRSRREADLRQFAAARSQLARLVLDLDALDVSHRTADAPATTRVSVLAPPGGDIGTQGSWDHIEREIRGLQADEAHLIRQFETTRPLSRTPQDAHRRQLEAFVDRTGELAAHTLDMEAALAVSSGWATAGRSLRRLLAPAFRAVTALTTGVEEALDASPRRTRLAGDRREELAGEVQRLRAAHRRLLALSMETASARQAAGHQTWSEAWTAADAALTRAGRDLRGTLESVTGRQLQSDGSTVEGWEEAARAAWQLSGAVDGPTRDGGARNSMWPRRLRTAALAVAGLAVVTTAGWGAGTLAVNSLDTYLYPWERTYPGGPTGSEQLSGITVHDPDGLGTGLPAFREEEIRKDLDDRFSVPVDLIIAVRDFDELDWKPKAGRSDWISLEYADVIEAAQSIKSDLAEDPAFGDDVIHPGAGELKPPHLLMPVYVDGRSQIVVFPAITGTLPLGQDLSSGGLTSATGLGLLPADRGWPISSELERFSSYFYDNAAFHDPTDPSELFFWIMLSVILLGTAVLQLLYWLGRLSAGAGRWSPQAKRLREAEDRLNRLLLDEDARDYAMAVSASAADVAAYGLTHQMLLWCARTLEELRLTPRAERLGSDFKKGVDRLLERLEVLTARHHSTLEQMDRLLQVDRTARLDRQSFGETSTFA